MNKKYPVAIQARTTPIINSIFLIGKKMFFYRISKDYWCTNQLPISFGTALIRRINVDFHIKLMGYENSIYLKEF